MGNALEIARYLGRLKKYTVELHVMIEDGSFYRLSFLQRRKLIRRVKKLYSKLLGPVSPVRLHHVIAAAGILALNTACFAPIGVAPDYTSGGTDDPGSGATGGGSVDLTPYFAARGQNPYGLQPSPVAVDYDPYTEGAVYRVWWARSSAFADLDADGDLDAVHSGAYLYYAYSYTADGGWEVTYSGHATLIFQENTGSATEPVFAPPVCLPVDDVPFGGGIAFADMDADGDLDLWMATNTLAVPYSHYFPSGPIYLPSQGMAFFENVGTAAAPQFRLRHASSDPTLTPLKDRNDVAAGDIDSDGDVDLVVAGPDGIVLLRNNGTPQEPRFDFNNPDAAAFGIDEIIGYAHSGFQAALVDIDRDGDLDLVAAGTWDTPTTYHYNEIVAVINDGDAGTPIFPDVVRPAGLHAYNQFFPRAVDIDGDGDEDVFALVESRRETGGQGQLEFYENLVVDEE